jgi:hypothetical protein
LLNLINIISIDQLGASGKVLNKAQRILATVRCLRLGMVSVVKADRQAAEASKSDRNVYSDDEHTKRIEAVVSEIVDQTR